MPFKSYRVESRTDWGTNNDEPLNRDQIKAGCLLRIADATEAMAKNYLELQRQVEDYKRRNDLLRKNIRMLYRRSAGLRGVITRMKRKSQS